MQTITYGEAIKPITMGILGVWNIKENKTISFSKNSQLNLDSLDKLIDAAKKYLPANYIKNLEGGLLWDNKPNVDSAIWFLRIFVKEEAKDKYTPYVAFKIVFEGTDAMRARWDPKVLEVQFITDKIKLQELISRLEHLPKL